MENTTHGKIQWKKAGLIVLVSVCLFVLADVLVLLVDFQRQAPADKVALRADMAPPTTDPQYRNGSRRAISGLPPTAQNPDVSPTDNDATQDVATENTELESAEPQPEQKQTTASTSTLWSDDAISDTANASTNESYNQLPSNDEMQLQGVMVGNGTGIAVLEYRGTTYTVGEGEKIGPYSVEAIDADRVTLDKKGQQSQVSLNNQLLRSEQDAHTPDATTPAAAPAHSSNVGNYPPVLPKPHDVPLPPQPVALPSERITAKADKPDLPARAQTTSPHDSGTYQISDLDFPPESSMGNPSSNSKLTREELDEFTRKGAALMADIRGREVENGRGIRLEFRNPDNALAKLGLRDGDIVQRINSRSIVNIEDVYNSVLTLRDAPQVDIDIVRNQQPMSLFHEFPER